MNYFKRPMVLYIPKKFANIIALRAYVKKNHFNSLILIQFNIENKI